jgi:hypothetical protein
MRVRANRNYGGHNMGLNDKPTGSDAGKQKGGIGYVLMWFLGVPIPVLILFALLRGCA